MKTFADSHLKYRPDIDGLRALAVLPVVIYHLGAGLIAPGGFVGVDIFFVISGFLITKIIHTAIFQTNDFSVVDFYHRRIRRILPAVMVVYLFSAIGAAALYFPDEQVDVAKSIFWSASFAANLFFYKTIDYFSEADHINPVLHTWSLSVEEQFYFVMPAILFTVGLTRSKWPGAEKLTLWCALGLSLVAACLLVKGHQQAVFYLLPFRAWELLAGSLIGIGAVPQIRTKTLAEVASAIGISLIVGSIALLSSSSVFPGYLALPPVLGAALVIHAGSAGHSTLVARLLGLPPIRFIGLISYSLYLWHWPLIVFYPFVFGQTTASGKVILLLASLAAGTLSWAFIEKPFRSGEALRSRKAAFIAAGVSIAGVAALALVMPRASQLVDPTSPAALAILDQKAPPGKEWREGSCFLTSAAKDASTYDADKCMKAADSKTNVLLVGDSHGAMYYPALSRLPSINVMQATSSGCVPVLHPQGEARCVGVMKTAFERVAHRNFPARTIILAGRWKAHDGPGLADRVRSLQAEGLRVIVLGPVNEYSQPLPRLAALAVERQKINPFSFLKSEGAADDEAIRKAVSATGASYVSVRNLICAPQCRVWADKSHLMQFDYGHLTPAGARWVVQQFGRELMQ